jgi:disulfide bond formation protein DsbB
MKKLVEYFQVPRHLALAVVLVSAGALAAAYTAQYGFGLQPCNLCLYQRVPYSLNIVGGIAALLATFRYPRLATLLLFLSALLFLTGAGIAGFHVGVEHHWWQGLESCSDTLPKTASVEELRKLLAQRLTVVRCDQVRWSLFGISMAGYNFLASLTLGGGVLYLLRRKGP